MSEELRYDEDDAIKFIRLTLPPEANSKYTDDDILYIIDIIWEWYDKNGYLSLDSEVSEEEEHDIVRITDYVSKQLKKDGEIEPDNNIELIVRGEIQYEQSIDDVV